MQYALLIYHGDPRGSVSDETIAAFMTEITAHNEEMKRGGHLLMTGGLGLPETATAVTRRNGKLSMTDGPFAETKEFLGGLYVVEARDLNEALKLAADLPMARFATIEVRPLNHCEIAGG